jgi:hypothetical protein
MKTRTRNDNAKASHINAKASISSKMKVTSISVKARNSMKGKNTQNHK